MARAKERAGNSQAIKSNGNGNPVSIEQLTIAVK